MNSALGNNHMLRIIGFSKRGQYGDVGSNPTLVTTLINIKNEKTIVIVTFK